MPRLKSVRVDPATCQTEDLRSAAAWLLAGGIVAFPTDTFYGLAVNPMSEAAVTSLFALKGRDARVAVPLVAASAAAVEALVGPLDAGSRRLAAAYWPGPLSLVLGAPSAIAASVHGGLGTIAIRVPAHPVACALAAACGGVVTATSANRSGEPAAGSVAALGWLASDPLVFVIDAGATPGGVASTIVDAREARAILVREGAIAWSRVLESLHE